jgi:Zn-dependent peptidase ImmA (M78 family)/transcriptional regulator with XRE-family HTH domain
MKSREPARIGKNVQRLRKFLRLSQEATAAFLELSRPVVSAIEADERDLSYEELMKLCELFHCEPYVLMGMSDLLLPNTPPPPSAHLARATKETQSPTPQDEYELSKFKDFLLRPTTKRPLSSVVEKIRDASTTTPKKTAELACRLLEIKTVPVDVYEAINRLGVTLRFSALGNLSGALICEPNACGILVNSDQPDDRVRFSAAHELAHLLLSHEKQQAYSLKGRHHRGIERDADDFAAEFLMPDAFLQKHFAETKSASAPTALDVYRLSEQFSVSYQAMIYRLSKLQLISNQAVASFLEEKPSSLREKLEAAAPKRKTKAVIYQDRITKDVADHLADAPTANSPEWVRQVQESAAMRYIGETRLEERKSHIREVYESVALWIANNRPVALPRG